MKRNYQGEFFVSSYILLIENEHFHLVIFGQPYKFYYYLSFIFFYPIFIYSVLEIFPWFPFHQDTSHTLPLCMWYSVQLRRTRNALIIAFVLTRKQNCGQAQESSFKHWSGEGQTWGNFEMAFKETYTIFVYVIICILYVYKRIHKNT